MSCIFNSAHQSGYKSAYLKYYMDGNGKHFLELWPYPDPNNDRDKIIYSIPIDTAPSEPCNAIQVNKVGDILYYQFGTISYSAVEHREIFKFPIYTEVTYPLDPRVTYRLDGGHIVIIDMMNMKSHALIVDISSGESGPVAFRKNGNYIDVLLCPDKPTNYHYFRSRNIS